MVLFNNSQKENEYQYVTLELSHENSNVDEYAEREEFLVRAIKSYYSIETTLNNEGLFDLLAYNFATKQLHFLFLSSKKQEIIDFFEYIKNQYQEWSGAEIKFEIIEDKIISESLLLATSARIHTLADQWKEGYCSSLRSYLFDDAPVWLACHHVKRSYGSAVDYYEYLKIYKRKEFIVELKSFVPLSAA